MDQNGHRTAGRKVAGHNAAGHKAAGHKAAGHKAALHFEHPPQRVVSLVPSMTESLFDLGLGEAVVGVTDYCVHPHGPVEQLPHLGGPKNPHLEEIIALKPDLVLVNQEENTPKTVQTLETAGLRVWITFPQSVIQAMDVLWALAGIFHSSQAAARLETLQQALNWAVSAQENQPARPYFCPIWEDQTGAGVQWWMTFNRHTYANDVLKLAGGQNVFADRQRRYPLEADLDLAEPEEAGERDTRYPRIQREEIRLAQPELILLPSEPYSYGEEHIAEFSALLAGLPHVEKQKIVPVDGSLITWHGTRLARALRELPSLFA